jgi:hypothetical protein
MVWNLAGIKAVANLGALPPMPISRIYAVINIAMHDALNNILPIYHTYIMQHIGHGYRHANAAAAVAQAAHDVIVKMLPSQQAFADALLITSLASIRDDAKKSLGIELGKMTAASALASRNNDGAATAQFPYLQGTLPGAYRSTPPNDITGFVAVPGWGKVQPFCLARASQFRPAPPYPINSHAYTLDFNEVKRLGSQNSIYRTVDQTEIGLFWLEPVPTSFNRLARTMIVQKNLGAWAAARLLALMAMAEADANIACFEAKFFYNYWRPITAIRLGDTDGNPNTIGDEDWEVLAPPTPPVPDYPSNHSCNAGAGEEIFKLFFGNDNMRFTQISNSLPNVTRSFTRFSQAGRENCLARIYVGYHFRNAIDEGEKQGKKIGSYIFNKFLRERN